MGIVEFLRARLDEDEAQARHAIAGDLDYLPSIRCKCGGGFYLGGDAERVLREVEAKRRIVDLHADWPVLVEGPLEFGRAKGGSVDTIAMQASRQIAWMTERAYVARFGEQPPTAPMIRALAAIYADHEDFQSEWR